MKADFIKYFNQRRGNKKFKLKPENIIFEYANNINDWYNWSRMALFVNEGKLYGSYARYAIRAKGFYNSNYEAEIIHSFDEGMKKFYHLVPEEHQDNFTQNLKFYFVGKCNNFY